MNFHIHPQMCSFKMKELDSWTKYLLFIFNSGWILSVTKQQLTAFWIITMGLDKMSILMAPNHGLVLNLFSVRSKSMELNHGLVWNLISVRSKSMVPNHGQVWNLFSVMSKSMVPNHGHVWNFFSVGSKSMEPNHG